MTIITEIYNLLFDFKNRKKNRFLRTIDQEFREKCINNLAHSKAQKIQDLFVLSELKFKENGFFVEFGATNGIELSNTFLLEKRFNWKGILAEPAKSWHNNLYKNRTAQIETKCVWGASGEILKFNETSEAELSTIATFTNSDKLKESRQKGIIYDVETISLEDLLDKYNAPELIDYLSIDTEGSEFEILQKFNFDKYKFRVITCEHNYSETRKKIHQLLTKNGYKRKYERLSKFDDWYVLDR